MKKTLVIALSAALALGVTSSGFVTAVNAETVSAGREAQAIYFVPGSYVNADGDTVYNTVSDSTKLTENECAAIYTANAYLCELPAGTELPVPETTNAEVTFNGWWAIENAEIVYYETVPDTTKQMFLYADWRAELSQPKDPVNPPEETKEQMTDYLKITRYKTGKDEIVGLFVSATDVPNAVQAGYGGPVQFYNEWFYLSPGDIMEIYVSGVYATQIAGPRLAPQLRNGKQDTQLESSGTSHTTSIIKKETEKTKFKCIAGDEHPYRIYIKFYDEGGTMTIYMERQDK